MQLSFTGTELYRFELSIGCNAKFCNFWMVAMARVELWRHSYVMVRHMEMFPGSYDPGLFSETHYDQLKQLKQKK